MKVKKKKDKTKEKKRRWIKLKASKSNSPEMMKRLNTASIIRDLIFRFTCRLQESLTSHGTRRCDCTNHSNSDSVSVCIECVIVFKTLCYVLCDSIAYDFISLLLAFFFLSHLNSPLILCSLKFHVDIFLYKSWLPEWKRTEILLDLLRFSD